VTELGSCACMMVHTFDKIKIRPLRSLNSHFSSSGHPKNTQGNTIVQSLNIQ
jgi:hypothetical protein